MVRPMLGEIAPNLWRVPEARAEVLAALAAKLNRRSTRCGGGITINVEGTESHAERDPEGVTRVYLYVLVRLAGETPRVAGHVFLARVEHTHAGNIVCMAPSAYDVRVPESLWAANATCDHCRTKRARRDTFLLQTPQGEFTRVGRTCLADYLRGEDIAGAMHAWRALAEIREALGEGLDEASLSECHYYPTIEDFLSATCSAIRQEGWVSRGAACSSNRVPTATLANFILAPKPTRDFEQAQDWTRLQPTECDREQAAMVLAWARASQPKSDYERNLHVAVALDHVTPRNAGLVASAAAGYLREVAAAAEARATPAAASMGHYGEVGKRYTLGVADCVACHVVEGDYGTTAIATFVAQGGYTFKWFASRVVPRVGVRYLLTGTVKKHTSYRGRAETILSRCKIVESGSE